MVEPVLAAVTICGNGLAPAKGIVKSRAGMVWKVWACSGAANVTTNANARMAKKICSGSDFDRRFLIINAPFQDLPGLAARSGAGGVVSGSALPARRLYSLRIAQTARENRHGFLNW